MFAHCRSHTSLPCCHVSCKSSAGATAPLTVTVSRGRSDSCLCPTAPPSGNLCWSRPMAQSRSFQGSFRGTCSLGANAPCAAPRQIRWRRHGTPCGDGAPLCFPSLCFLHRYYSLCFGGCHDSGTFGRAESQSYMLAEVLGVKPTSFGHVHVQLLVSMLTAAALKLQAHLQV